MFLLLSVCILVHFALFNSQESFNEIPHMKYEKIKYWCANTDFICKSNSTNICATRILNSNVEYKDFLNSCYLFMSNMCNYSNHGLKQLAYCRCLPRREQRGCLTLMKNIIKSTATQPTTISPLYDIDTAFDFHLCPLSCPDVYNPVCVGVNRGHGLYFKFFTFVNHCAGDLYYCKNWEEFSPPPDEDEMVKSSPLSWSLCAANRYIQFARFAEMTSSMGYYGWLAGDYK
ncbi:uncharacterized protein LOC126973675 [Leptidea sinapis]|uniref:uncharacterized protein LOC126973675 n=1 Tax=Leptidea sinapis TaxID=189913 RepID=UPI0021C3CF06|nr:uncharacterized protein LOC126973675 [Leptidea sinapis]